MKKILRRVLLMTVILVLAISVHALADYRLYSARTVRFPNQYGGGWSNQFTLSTRSNVSIQINISGNNQSYYINKGMTYLLQNISTGQKVYLAIPTNSRYNLNYTLSAVMGAGTYSFGVYYTGNQSFTLRFSVYGAGGINIPDNLEVMKGTTETVSVKPTDGSTNYVRIRSARSDNPGYATVTYNNSVTPPTVTVRGVAIGETTVTVTAQDGSSDTMHVRVTKFVPAPTLNYKSLTMNAGDKVYNAVENAVSSVTWSTSNANVAKVSQKGRIKAVGYGKCTIRARTVSNNKTYDLACTVKVNRTTPNFRASIVKYYSKKKLLKVEVENLSKVPMVIYSNKAELLNRETEKRVRKLKLKQGSSVTIPKGKEKTFYLKLKKKLGVTDLTRYYMKLYFRQDKRYYYAWITDDPDIAAYSWRKKPDVLYTSYSIDK